MALPLLDTSRLGIVVLRVTDMARALTVWRDLVGLQVLSAVDDETVLGVGRHAMIVLQGGASPAADRPVTGLFHVAVHVQTRADLARVLLRLRSKGYRHSAQDHLLSEALYFSDPDGNGIEIAFDTPDRAHIDLAEDIPTGNTTGGFRHSLLEPLDLDTLAAELPSGTDLSVTLPIGSHIGHIHFRTTDRDTVFAFYTQVIGLRPNINSAKFKFCDVGTSMRNHMIAFNHWAGLEMATAATDAPGVVRFGIIVPDLAAFAAIKDRLDSAGIANFSNHTNMFCEDPDGNHIEISAHAN